MIIPNVLQPNWNALRFKMQTQWGRMTDDDLDRVNGSRDRLIGLVQKKYGYAKGRAEQEVDHFLERIIGHS